MRGIGSGQKIKVFVIPEVRELIQREIGFKPKVIVNDLKSVGNKPFLSINIDSTESLVSAVPFSPTVSVEKSAQSRNISILKQIPIDLSHTLEDIVAWLIVNSLRSEQTQWTMLCLQNIANLYRKNAFKCLVEASEYISNYPKVIDKQKDPDDSIQTKNSQFEKAMHLFIEPLAFDLESGVPDPVPFEEKLRSMLVENDLFLTPKQHEIGHK
jgi:hypothetical protein